MKCFTVSTPQGNYGNFERFTSHSHASFSETKQNKKKLCTLGVKGFIHQATTASGRHLIIQSQINSANDNDPNHAAIIKNYPEEQ